MWEGIVTRNQANCTARRSITSLLDAKHTLFVYNCAILRILLDMYFVNVPRQFDLLCYIRDATNAGAEWVFAKRVKLAGKDFVTRHCRTLEDCLNCRVLIETRPTPGSPSIFVELCILQTPSVSQRTSTIRNCSDNCWVVVDAELFEDSCDQPSGDLLGHKVSLPLRSLISRLKNTGVQQSGTTSGNIV